MTDKPFSQACENNKHPILAQLRRWLPEAGLVLEIGTGTGQHAVCFAEALPTLTWQPSDQPGAEAYCLPWLAEANRDNIRPPLALDVSASSWPVTAAAAVFSANTAHIMAWPEVEAMFRGVARLLVPASVFCLYGPFNVHGHFTSASNQAFDQYLRSQKASMGIRDIDDLTALASKVGMVLEQDIEMPANNRLLVWRRLDG
ncbi:DUF938 domain-containing protein [Marinobacter sp. SS21]|uniref:DUF938 domain-containing protein n=1 Tax=Marinobacter sp. SS21 TaxID=2979460 RepID=UPI00232DA525|nr:DUF938 domain-containing protein [Marinobacter sp. SS21]MDC0662293.1 DUF938 domain-containing protein [Marinobacter sp. SS21]